MRKHASRGLVILGFATIVGCGATVETAPIPLSQLPSAVVKSAQKKMDDVTFDGATRETAGKRVSYLITGKDKKGKKHEIKVSGDGTVLESK